MSGLRSIRQHYPDLAGNYRLIADCILQRPEAALQMKVRDIAAVCRCDDAQVIRFCKKIGFDGFSALKNALAEELLMPQQAGVQSSDPFTVLREEFFAKTQRSLQETKELWAAEAFQKAVEALSHAKRILLFGMGASGLVAQDAGLKLLRLGLPAIYQPDSAHGRMLSGLLQQGDALLAVSFRGETAETCRVAQEARERGVYVIALTGYSNSRLASLGDCVLLTAADEQAFRPSAMVSRLAQLFTVDFLICELIRKDIHRSGQNLLQTFEALREP